MVFLILVFILILILFGNAVFIAYISEGKYLYAGLVCIALFCFLWAFLNLI